MSTQSRFAAAAVVVVVLLASGAVWVLRSPHSQVQRAEVPVPATDAAAPGSTAAATTRSFEKGEQLAYSVTVDSQTHQSVPTVDIPADFAMVLSGTLEAQVLEVRDQSAVLVVRLVLESKSGAGFNPKVERRPFLVEVDHQGQLLGFAREKEAPRAAARNQQSLVWEAQFSRHSSDAFTLADTTGVALATIEMVGDHQLRRTLTAYQSRWDHEPGDHTTLRGVMTVELGASPWFEKLSSRTTRASEGGRNTSTLELAASPVPVAFTDFDLDQTHYIWENLLPQTRHPDLVTRSVTSYDRKRQAKVAELTVEQALDQFADRVEKRVGVQSTWPELAAYFEVHPEAVRPAIKKYLAGELPREASGDFFLSVAKARTPEAREALLEIKRDDGAIMMDQVRAMFGLVLREDVGVDLAKELVSDTHRYIATRTPASDFLAGESMLALSTMSGSRDDAQVATVATQALSGLLQSEPPDSHASHLALHAIGNTGTPGLLPAVIPFTTSADLETRKAAAHAFSRMPASESDPMEVEWMQRETSPFVRKDAYLVFQQQHFNPGQGATRLLVEQALKDLKVEHSAFTRRSMVLLIAQSSINQEPQIRKALIQQARFERSKNSTLLNLFATVLSRDEVLEVLQ